MAERALQVALLLCLLSAFVVDAERRDKEEELEGPRDAKAIVGNRGGGMRLYRERPPRHGEQGGPRRTGEIEIKIGKIREGSNSTNGTDMNKPGQGRRRPDTGGPPGRGRPPRPGSEGLDDVEFNVTRRKNRNLQPPGQPHGHGAEIKGDCVILKCQLKDVNDSVLTVTICVVKDNGSLSNDDEETEVMSGQIKFSVQLENWPWSSDGEYVDVDFVVTPPRGRMVKERDGMGTAHRPSGRRGRPLEFDVGDNATIFFSRKVLVDGNWTDMDDRFPSPPRKHDNDKDYIITVRFPRFADTVFYDPTLDQTAEAIAAAADGGSTDGGTATYASIASLSVAFLLTLAAAHLAL